MERRAYATDITDEEWAILEGLVPQPFPGGRPPKWARREIVNAILYVLKTGCTWQLLPHDFPPYSTVFWYFRRWRKDGSNSTPCCANVCGNRWGAKRCHYRQPNRQNDGKRGLRGYDGGKKIKGRKRQILVDTQGFLLKVDVDAASLSDTQGGQKLLAGANVQFPRIQHLWTDNGYKQSFAKWGMTNLGWTAECVRRPVEPRREYADLLKAFLGREAYAQRYPKGFHVLPRRWVVERSLAWFDRQRRLSKDYEWLPESSEAWIYLASARLLWKRSVKLCS